MILVVRSTMFQISLMHLTQSIRSPKSTGDVRIVINYVAIFPPKTMKCSEILEPREKSWKLCLDLKIHGFTFWVGWCAVRVLSSGSTEFQLETCC